MFQVSEYETPSTLSLGLESYDAFSAALTAPSKPAAVYSARAVTRQPSSVQGGLMITDGATARTPGSSTGSIVTWANLPFAVAVPSNATSWAFADSEPLILPSELAYEPDADTAASISA